LQLLDNLRIDPQQNIAAVYLAIHFAQLDIDLIAYRKRALDHAGSSAYGAGHGERALERLLDAFAGMATRPKSLNCRTFDGARSDLRASSNATITLLRFLRSSMSMKSMTMMPPRSRKRIWRTISGMASRLVLRMVSSRRAVLPTYLPV